MTPPEFYLRATTFHDIINLSLLLHEAKLRE